MSQLPENENEKEILDCQEQIRKNSKVWYPPMKIVDMYFWQLGYDEFQKKKTKAAK